MTPDWCDALPDGVVVADGSGVVTVVNAMARSMLGPHARAGHHLRDVLALVDQHGTTWWETHEPYGGLGIRSGIPEQSWLLPDGHEVLVAARLQRSGPGAPVERVALTLRSGRGRARLDRERSDLVATVAHELRSPLTGVKGFVQAMLNRWDVLSDEQKKLMLTTVNADAARLTRLIAELLDVARLDTGRLSIYPREVGVEVLLRRVVDSVGAATSRPVELEVGEPDLEVFADPDKFTQVVTNLVENAVRHGDGRVVVSVAALPAGADHPGVSVTVSDEGEGIPEDLRRRVLTKFWTQGGSTAGSGLGMYIASGLTRAHGGELEIGDRPGGGASVTVRWPSVDRRDQVR
ncbi:PAS domain-containing sensor histidine kinase [Nocardioides sp. Y6]|uniref:histidine kinase n=1 Tax=Nocardioides malaquae TaxID=2773426 RepID=A0ABR9RNA4_9ACTN|nr:PAS domain-containing sensor histidine kinase [Nocardioides malaquae]MBE7323046.1 PAS domain-containing sensor histidine kinase [Nocardioides malaquae]